MWLIYGLTTNWCTTNPATSDPASEAESWRKENLSRGRRRFTAVEVALKGKKNFSET